MFAVHVAIVRPSAARGLLDGRKRIESRFYSHKRLPFNRIAVGDVIHFKLSGGRIIGTAKVSRIAQFEDLTPVRIDRLRARFNHAVLAPAGYWAAKRRSRYGILIWLDAFASPPAQLRIPRQYGNGWLTFAPAQRAPAKGCVTVFPRRG